MCKDGLFFYVMKLSKHDTVLNEEGIQSALQNNTVHLTWEEDDGNEGEK